ncbi:hypothetical protein [Ilumatobacter sp.]|uniref:hypothetical protein n=1 Tax=Ilumatobacter sp. TaxID=1967498 RepID=UPI003C5714A5
MAFEDIDRRRFLILALLTLIALPAIYFYSQRDDATADDPTSVTVDEAALDVNDASNRPPIVVSDADPAFLDGPVGEAVPGVNEIAVPTRPETAPLVLSASYRSTVPGVNTCLLRNVGLGIPVTITNLDNGRSLTCVTAQAPQGQVADVVLHTGSFTKLADVTEAPITIELTQ